MCGMNLETYFQQLSSRTSQWGTFTVEGNSRIERIWGQLRGVSLKESKLRIFLIDYQYPIVLESGEELSVVWHD